MYEMYEMYGCSGWVYVKLLDTVSQCTGLVLVGLGGSG